MSMVSSKLLSYTSNIIYYFTIRFVIQVKGVQFDEVFDMDSMPSADNVLGLVFLFKYQKAEARETAYPPPGLFFAKQVRYNIV